MFDVVAAGLNSIDGVPVIVPVIAAEPSKLFPHKLLAVASLVAVAALPVQEPDDPLQLPVTLPVILPTKVALIVAGNVNDTLALPFTLTAVLVLVPSVILMFLAVPQFAVVMLAVPLNEVPLMVRAACNFVADAALPVQEPEEPEQFPVTLPVRGPENPDAEITLVLGLTFTDLAKIPVLAP